MFTDLKLQFFVCIISILEKHKLLTLSLSHVSNVASGKPIKLKIFNSFFYLNFFIYQLLKVI